MWGQGAEVNNHDIDADTEGITPPFIPDEQILFTVVHGVVLGMPAFNAA